MNGILQRPGGFALRVLKGFRRNQGLLLSGAVAYYMLLSIVPLLALLLIGLSQLLPEERLLATVQGDLKLVVPAVADTLIVHIRNFLQHKEVIGWVGTLFLIFFSTIAFTVLENAMSVIFFHRVAIHRRHFLISALIPFLFIAFIGFGLLLITLISGALQTLHSERVALFGWVWELGGISGSVLYLLGFGGLILLLTGLYLVMPVGRIAWHHALIGGSVAAVLWELSRHVLVWYFTTLSLVNIVYGSFATAVVVLLSFEVAAIILLLGAQVIAEFERCSLDLSGVDNGFHT
jgi:YihY family inner membrane protein